MKTTSFGILLIFGIFWSALTLVFDRSILVAAKRQILALDYPSTEGTIVSSAVTYHDDSEGGTTHGISLSYNYSVGGKQYTGTRYRYGSFSSSDCAWANSVVAANSPGAQVKVFYNVRDPENSVLATGLAGSDLFMFQFMTPFNAVMLGFWWAGWTHLRRRWFKPMAGGVKIIHELGQTRVRLIVWSPMATALATMAVLTFVSIFPIAFLGGGFHPTMRTMEVAWTLILVTSVGAGIWQLINVLSGKHDLVIDEIGGALELPAYKSRKGRCRVPLSNVEGVYVETIQKPSSDGESTPIYAPTLRIEGATPGTEQLVQWFDQDKASQFVKWFREKLPQKCGPTRPLAGKF